MRLVLLVRKVKCFASYGDGRRASRLAEKVVGHVGRAGRVGQLFQEIYNERSSLPLTLPISFVKYLAIDLADFKELSSLANSKREALNIMLISSKKALHVVLVLHVLPDIF